MKCPLCGGEAGHHRVVDAVDFFDCAGCDFLFADPGFLALVDAGTAPRKYDDGYWKAELKSAWQRSFGSSLARFAEGVIYTRIPIQKFIDIGAGPGYLLEALQHQLPSSAHKFYGVEMFPGAETAAGRLKHPGNYIIGSLADTGQKFQMGTCIEVLEHLTPVMVSELAVQMANASVPGSLFMMNTSLAAHVRTKDPGYLDPLRRGHITTWSVTAARKVFGAHGFTVHPLDGKQWAFVLEFKGERTRLIERIWNPLPTNLAMVEDPVTGSGMYLLGLESARAYALHAQLAWERKQR